MYYNVQLKQLKFYVTKMQLQILPTVIKCSIHLDRGVNTECNSRCVVQKTLSSAVSFW